MKKGDPSTTPGGWSGFSTSRPFTVCNSVIPTRANGDHGQQQDIDFTVISDSASTITVAEHTKAQNWGQLRPAPRTWNPWIFLVLVHTLLIFATFGLADYRAEVLSDSPIAYWRLNELSGLTAADSSGNGHNATYLNGITLGVPGLLAGDPDTAVELDGTTGRIDSNSFFLNTTTGITVEVWFVARSFRGKHTLVLGGFTSPSIGYHWLYLDHSIPNGLLCWEYAAGTRNPTQCITFAPLIGQRYHLVVTHDYLAKYISFYINGSLYPHAIVTHTDDVVPLSNQFVRLGSYDGRYGFIGVLDEVAIYPGVLSASRIRTHSTAGGSATRSDIYVAPAPTGSNENDGSGTTPVATIQYAAEAVLPGGTVHVAPGTYSESIVNRIGGTETARVRFVSDTKWGAHIRSIGVIATWRNYGNYTDIEGFDITGDGSVGIDNVASYVRIIRNDVHDIPASCPGGGAGIDNENYSAHDSDTIGNVVHDIGNPDAVNPCALSQGIYHSNLRGHIWNNIAYRNSGWGIHVWHLPTDVVVANNLVFENRHGGIVIGGQEAPAGGMLVTNNIAIYNGGVGGGYGWGIMEEGSLLPTNRYVNNLSYGNTFVGIDVIIGVEIGTITQPPGLVNYQPDGNGDYHLRANSICVDAGTNEGAPPYDFDGVLRPQGSAYDIGPYEYNPTPPDFAVDASPSSVSVRAGQLATYNVTVSPVSGVFNGTVTLACSNLPARSSCSFSPSTVTPGGNPVTSVLTISTTASAMLLKWRFRGLGPRYPLALWASFSMLLLFGVLIIRTQPRLERLGFFLPAALVICLLVLLAACGGGVGKSSTPFGTPPGAYSITVTGTSGTPTHSTTTSLIVQ